MNNDNIKAGGVVVQARLPAVQRLYLTCNDEFDSKKPWGGNHITICGENFTKPVTDVCQTSFYRNRKSWRFSKSPNYEIVQIKNSGVWTIRFESDVLDELSKELDRLGFTNIKGPLMTKSKWHVSLNGINETEARQKADLLVFKDRPKWYLTLCEDFRTGNYRWTRL